MLFRTPADLSARGKCLNETPGAWRDPRKESETPRRTHHAATLAVAVCDPHTEDAGRALIVTTFKNDAVLGGTLDHRFLLNFQIADLRLDLSQPWRTLRQRQRIVIVRQCLHRLVESGDHRIRYQPA